MPGMGEMCSFYGCLVKSLLSPVFARLYNPQQVPSRNLTGQVAIITGANSGIGLSIATSLAQQGADVHLACRNADRGAAAVDHVVAQCDGENVRVSCRILDIGDLSSVRSFCQSRNKMVHNAGIAAAPTGGSTKTKEGLEIIYTTDFLGSFLMTYLLESCLSSTARVVLTSSTGSYSAASQYLQNAIGHAKPSDPGFVANTLVKGRSILGIEGGSGASAYGLSKAQQVLFAAMLQGHFDAHASPASSEPARRTAHAFMPGFTSTPNFSEIDVTWQTWCTNPLFAVLKATETWIAVDTDEGAKTGAWLAT